GHLSDETIYVSPQTNTDLLLGQTWIKKYQAILNCKDQCVTITSDNGSKRIQYIPAYDDNDGDPHQQYNVRLVHDVTIKPRTVQPIDAICPPILNADTVIFRPRQQLQEEFLILIPNSLLNIYHHRTTLYIVNHTDTDCVLPKNSTLGKVHHVRSASLCCNVTQSFESLRSDAVIPQRIEENINTLIKHLQSKQQELIRPMLLQEWNVFDTSKPSQAANLKTEHRIITQDHPPIYQSVYRVPEPIKQQQKELTDEMERNGQISRSQSPWEFYLDDIIIYSETIRDHIKDVHAVLYALNSHSFKLNTPKCALFHEQIEYLTHEINHQGYSPLKNNIQAYRSFVKNFEVAYPLLRFQAKKGEFVWKSEHQLAFDTLKQQLVSEPCMLKFPLPNVSFILATDASSKHGIGVTLKQKVGKNEHVIVYLSQNLNKIERKWGVTVQECWAIVWAVKKLRIYLYGTKFTVITNHHPLCWLNKHKSGNERLYRWSLVLQEYEFDIKHKGGSCHLDADCLSRSLPNDATTEDTSS
ncbi:unnamed protein product, partial [Didymodactylos carnosus]